MAPSLGTLALMIAIVAGIGLVIAVVGLRLPRKNVYACKRCGLTFQRSSVEGYPARCPRCGASDWNVARD